MFKLPKLLLVSTGLLVLAGSAAAQAPDGLDGGPCCTVVEAKLPQFPNIGQESLNICWLNCDVEAVFNCRALWKAPVPLNTTNSCGRYKTRLRLFDSSTGLKKWRGRMNLTYSRTWFESDGANQRLQVWRFLVNGNLRATADAGAEPCPRPPCAKMFKNRMRMTGYLDYAQDLSTGAISNAWMVHHACDVIDHAAGFPRAGVFHPERTYTFVGPAAGFAISAIQPVALGGSSLEAVRRVRLPLAGATDTFCEFEEQVDAGLDPLQELCLCGDATGPFQYVISDLGLGSSCGTSIFTPGGPFLPGYVSQGLGAWTDPLTYPGVERLRWSCGGYDYFDPCVGVTRREVFYGVTTFGGYDAIQIINTGLGLPLPRTFVDQGNSILRRDGLSTTMNILYGSDHILNLNFD